MDDSHSNYVWKAEDSPPIPAWELVSIVERDFAHWWMVDWLRRGVTLAFKEGSLPYIAYAVWGRD